MNVSLSGRSWHRLYPERWQRELAALRTAGLTYRISYPNGRVRLTVQYPVAEPHRFARIRIDFGLYPWFPPTVSDPFNELGVTRHRSPFTNVLCLLADDSEWTCETTVADLLSSQIPKLIATNAPDLPPDVHELEIGAPEGPLTWSSTAGPAVLVPNCTVPDEAESGVLVARVNGTDRLATVVVQEIHAPDWIAKQDRFADLESSMPMLLFGQWLRVPDFDPSWTTNQLWARVEPRLTPLEVDPCNESHISANSLQLVGLRVPAEVSYRAPGEVWVFIIVATEPKRRPRRRAFPCRTQVVTDCRARTPGSATLADKHVVLVGIGAVGHHVAEGLARAGVGHLDLIDRDTIDINTRTRQPVSLVDCGLPKTIGLAVSLSFTAPTTPITARYADISDLHLDADSHESIRRSFARADLVIDATANPAVTRFIGAIRHAAGKPFLHVSATAGAWGGVVALTSPISGCWACIELHRHDTSLPVPHADPTGWVTPAGCATPTFTGDNASLGTIAFHALRVATGNLTGERGIGEPGVWVAAMRDPAGTPQPVTWTGAPIPVHPACPLHDPTLIAGAVS